MRLLLSLLFLTGCASVSSPASKMFENMPDASFTTTLSKDEFNFCLQENAKIPSNWTQFFNENKMADGSYSFSAQNGIYIFKYKNGLVEYYIDDFNSLYQFQESKNYFKWFKDRCSG